MHNSPKKRNEAHKSETIRARIEVLSYFEDDQTESTSLIEMRINDLILRQARNEDERMLFEEKMRQLSA